VTQYQLLHLQVVELQAFDDRLEQFRKVLPHSHLGDDLLQGCLLLVRVPRVQGFVKLFELALPGAFKVCHKILSSLNIQWSVLYLHDFSYEL
jgi:hypothetical protein